MMEEEEGEGGEMGRKKEKGEEMDLPLESFPIMDDGEYSFETLAEVIPRVEKGVRIKVYRKRGLHHPITKVGRSLIWAYQKVGFSFIPVEVVAEPPLKEGKAPEDDFGLPGSRPAGIGGLGGIGRFFQQEEQAERMRRAMRAGADAIQRNRPVPPQRMWAIPPAPNPIDEEFLRIENVLRREEE